MDNIKISIVLPALNSIDYIRQCVDSILAQTFRDFELLCIDAGSTDGTLELFNQYAASDSRVKVIGSDMKSYGHQVNLGMDAARGEYLGIVESDDFIRPDMYEDLYSLTGNGAVDVVKGNFYDYFDYEGMKPIAAPNGERKKMPSKGKVFTVNQYPHILSGHPSIWSCIYRLEFLRNKKIRFMEIPGGGWTDNPFFFETMCSARSICWTPKPYYYYRKSNPNSSSNKIPDLTLPVRRMMDNLDVTERFELSDEAMGIVYERAIIYLNGSYSDAVFPVQDSKVREEAQKLYSRLDEKIVDRQLKGWFRTMYYNFRSPVMLRRPVSGRILIYDYMPWDINNKFINLSEERISQIRRLLDARYDIDIYLLTVRGSLEPDKPYPRIEKMFNHVSQQLFTYEVVNHHELTVEMYDGFCERFGPFDAEYFISSSGIDTDMIGRTSCDTIDKASGAETSRRLVSSFSQLMDIVKKLPEHDDITISSEEYQLILRENDYYHRIMEDNMYGDFFDYAPYKAARGSYKIYKKIEGGILCCKEHGIPYTIKLMIKRRGI